MPMATTNDGATIFYKDWGMVALWCSATAGRSTRTCGTRSSCSWRRTASAGSPTIVVGTVVRVSPGTATRWTVTPTTSPPWSRRSTCATSCLLVHSTGGGEVVRYIGRHGSGRVSKVVLVGAIPPLDARRRPATLHGTPIEVFDDLRAKVLADRSQLFADLSAPFFGANRPAFGVCPRRLRRPVLADGHAGQPEGASTTASDSSPRATSTTTCRRIDVPTLVIHGDDDQIVPIDASARLTVQIVEAPSLKVYPGRRTDCSRPTPSSSTPTSSTSSSAEPAHAQRRGQDDSVLADVGIVSVPQT